MDNTASHGVIAAAPRVSRTLLANLLKILEQVNALMSAGGLNSWVFLSLITWCLDRLRRRISALVRVTHGKVLSRYYIDSVHSAYDPSFEWIKAYLEAQPRFLKSTNLYESMTGVRETYGAAAAMSVKSEDPVVLAASEAVLPSFIPAFQSNYWFIYKRTLMRIANVYRERASWRGISYISKFTVQCYDIRVFSKDKTVLLMFLADAKRLYEATRPPKIELYIFNSKKPDFWDAAPTRQKRNWDGIILDTDVKDRLRDSVREFFASELWYAAKGVNWTMGVLLHGPPGTGKTSSVIGLASEFDLPIYVIPLNSSTLDDEGLCSAVRSISATRSILLLEDVGAWYAAYKDQQTAKGNSNGNASKNGQDSSTISPGTQEGKLKAPANGISLSTLLNMLDGVEPMNGIVTILTTNHLEGIDDALRRPGRIDLELELRKATKEQAKELFRAFYSIPDQAGLKLPKMHTLDQDAVTDLATKFSGFVEDEEFSTAELQGQLLCFKKEPEKVVETMPVWVAAQREKQKLKIAEQELTAELKAAVSLPAEVTEVTSKQEAVDTKPGVLANGYIGDDFGLSN